MLRARVCYASKPSRKPCHYYAVKAVVLGGGDGVSNGSEVTICATWYDKGCRSPRQVNCLLTESWRAQYGSLSGNYSSGCRTCQGDCGYHLKSLQVVAVAYKLWIRNFSGNKCARHSQSCTNDILWVSVSFLILLSITCSAVLCPRKAGNHNGWDDGEWRLKENNNNSQRKGKRMFTFDNEFSKVWDSGTSGGLSDAAVKVLISSLDAVELEGHHKAPMAQVLDWRHC